MNDIADDKPVFRYVIGAIAIGGGLLSLAGLYFVPIPDGNKEALLLAAGLVLGWGSTVIGYEFGSSPSGRKAADAGLQASQNLATSSARIAEQAAVAALPVPAAPVPQNVTEAADQVAKAAEQEAAVIAGEGLAGNDGAAEELPDYAR